MSDLFSVGITMTSTSLFLLGLLFIRLAFGFPQEKAPTFWPLNAQIPLIKPLLALSLLWSVGLFLMFVSVFRG